MARIVAALGGNALLQRGERPDAEIQQRHVKVAVDALAPLTADNELIVTHGNGPQVGMFALESAADRSLTHAYPFDVLGAQTQGMIGYWLLQAFHNALRGRDVASLITQTLVAAADPAFADPTKFVGPSYPEGEARRRAEASGWTVKADGDAWRRVVPSPRPQRVVETPLIGRLVADGAVVVCAGGGGAPVVEDVHGDLKGVDAVVDKDFTAALLAEALQADILLLLTDVSSVMIGYGTPAARPIRRTTTRELRATHFPDGSMGPKVDAVCQFVDATGGTGAIGSLGDVQAILAGTAGTTVTAGTTATGDGKGRLTPPQE